MIVLTTSARVVCLSHVSRSTLARNTELHRARPRRTTIRRVPSPELRIWAASTEEATGKEDGVEIKDQLFDALSITEAYLVSTQQKVPVTSLWTATEKCVMVFARSMGCFFCQEYARQLKRDVLPKLEGTGIRLFLVSIGTPERGIEFSDLTGFPKSQLLADPENALYDAVGFFRNVQRTFFDPRTPLSIFGRVFRKDRGSDLVEATVNWKPWIPPRAEQALQQGGILVFEGQQCTFQYVDQSTGNHMDLEELLELVLEEE